MKITWTNEMIEYLVSNYENQTYKELAANISRKFNIKLSTNAARKAYERYKYPIVDSSKSINKPKILVLDIETAPMEVYTWSLWQDNIPLNMVIKDWSILCYAAKWVGEDEIFYEDTRNQRDVRDDSKILKNIWKLMDEADIILGQNSNQFDLKKLNSRFLANGMKPPSTYRKYDTKVMSKKYFSHTSNKLEFLSKTFNESYTKLDHAKFAGFTLWKECLKGNKLAFQEMEDYNKHDILSTEEYFLKILPWDNTINYSVFNDSTPTCSCGSTSFKKSGFYYTNSSKFQKHKCTSCGSEYRDKVNLLKK